MRLHKIYASVTIYIIKVSALIVFLVLSAQLFWVIVTHFLQWFKLALHNNDSCLPNLIITLIYSVLWLCYINFITAVISFKMKQCFWTTTVWGGRGPSLWWVVTCPTCRQLLLYIIDVLFLFCFRRDFPAFCCLSTIVRCIKHLRCSFYCLFQL